MKDQFVVVFNPVQEEWGKARRILLELGFAEVAKGTKQLGGYSLTLAPEEFEKFRAQVEGAGFPPESLFWRRDRRYTKRELQSAPFLSFIAPLAPKAYGGPKHGTRYDLAAACPACGTGAIQVSPLVLNRSETSARRDVFQTLDHEILVSERVVSALEKAGVTGVEFRQVVSQRASMPWFQIIAEFEMPPMDESTMGVILDDEMRPCPRCHRDGRFDSPKEPRVIKYAGVDANDLPDFVHTYERFGKGVLRAPIRESHFAAPVILVKPVVYRTLGELRVRGIGFEPVEFRAEEQPEQGDPARSAAEGTKAVGASN